MNRSSVLIIFIALLALAPCCIARGQEIKTSDWLEDFAQLKREMSGHYANLDWAVEARGLNLRELSLQTESRLGQARTETEAKRTIESFLDAFGDGHLSVQWAPEYSDKASRTASEPSGIQMPLCQRLRYQRQKFVPKLVFTELNKYKEINTQDSIYFPIGVLQFGPNKNVGLISISIFSEYAFPDLCERAAVEMKLLKESPCDDKCEDLLERGAANLLTAALARQLRALKRSNINFLLVDVTGNGGGTNWIEPAARTLSAKSLRSPRQQFLRHEHWTKQLEKRLGLIEAEVPQSAYPIREVLLRAGSILRRAIAESRRLCERDSVWENRKPGCSIRVKSPPLYPQSVLPYSRPGLLPDIPSSRFLFYPSRYKYQEGVYSGPLMVLVDQGTWSSAEYFAAMLKDNNAATIIGAPTGGAGCGYTNGGISTILKNSRARVKIPDCVRLRSDGSNEVAGITPDVLIPWRANDSRYQRVKRVFDALYERLNIKTKR